MKILIIDDNPDIRNLIKTILKPLDFEIFLAASGTDGLKILADRPIDLIVLDIIMPEIDGFAVCRKIKKDPNTRDIPVIFLSVKDETESLVNGLKLGAVDYISKPFHCDEFIARINVHLDLHKNKNRLQKQLEENKQLIHILSHDLKNPVGCAHSFVEMMNEDPGDVAEYAGYARIALEQGLQIIDLIRDFMAINDNKTGLALSRLNLEELVGTALNILQNTLKQKNISADVDIPSDIFVKVDEISFINSVFNNLLTNAVKFSFNDSQIKIKAEQDQQTVQLSITDHGIGMSGEIRKSLFDINKSVSRMGTQGEKGTGFGMPLVKKFVEAYDGSIAVLSKEKKGKTAAHGTTVTLTLPAS